MASYNPNYFRKGLLPLLLLHLLQEKDMYGYELVKTIAARTNGTIIVKEGALYPILYQLCIPYCTRCWKQDRSANSGSLTKRG